MVLVPTWVIGEYIRELGVAVPITKLPTGIEVERFQKGNPHWLREKFGLRAEEKVLLFVGRLGQEKNVDFLLRAYRRVLEAAPEIPTRLVLVGGGPETKHLRRVTASLGLEERVLFAGPLSSQDVVHCYAGAYLFVFPSVTETQGLVIGEAKAAGVPAVAVNAFGVREMIAHGEDGYLTPLEEEAFADRIVELLTDPERHRRMVDAARERSRELSAKILGKRLEGIYRALIENHTRDKQLLRRPYGG
jgi:glycosyltransferase involved in cell wall biosynthesis